MTAVNVEKFNQAASEYNKRSMLACLVPLGILFLLCMAYVPFEQSVEAWLTSRFGATPGELLAIVPVALLVILGFGAMIIFQRRVDRKLGIACVHCSKPLINFRHIVIASRHCPYCGKRVIEEKPNAS